MRVTTRFTLLAAAAALAVTSAAHAAPVFINILTGGTSGVYYPIGVGLSQIYSDGIPGSKTSVQATKASVEAAVLGANVGNASVSPNPLKLTNGKAGKLTLNWTGLAVGSYIGRVTFAGASEPTFVTVVVTPAGTTSVAPAAGAPANVVNQAPAQGRNNAV